jgi:hypothetical protein
MIMEYSEWIITGVFAVTLLTYLLAAMSLDKKSIRREFYRAIVALLLLVGVSLLTIVVQPAYSNTALVVELLRWSPLVAVLLTVSTLPSLAKAWTTTGRNPRRRPNYEPTVGFKTIGDELSAMRTIVRNERETVKGSKSASAHLESMRHVRRFFVRQDPQTMHIIRRDLARDNFDLVQAMQALDP